ncbi:LPP20 lipoprotein [Alteromonadaceae bacterium Bs31]|nr:LPP20 lipoprotein [Alteromonadaceae bacterium Bs31]
MEAPIPIKLTAIILHAIVLVFFTNLCLAAAKVPDWFESRVPDTAEHMYGVGEGKSLSAATQSALEEVAGRLVTKIESDLETVISAKNNQVETSIDSKVRSEIGNTLISGYEVDASKKSGKSYYARVKVDKIKLLESNQTALNTSLNQLDEFLGKAQQTSVLQIFKKRRMLARNLDDASQKVMIVQALTDTQYTSAYHKKILNHRKNLNTQLARLIVFVDASPDLQVLSRKLVQQLSEEGIRATTDKPGNNTPTIRLKGSFERSERFDQKYVIANTSIDVYDEYSNPLSSKQLIVDGQAYLSHESAITSAINKTIDKLSQEGVARALGLI